MTEVTRDVVRVCGSIEIRRMARVAVRIVQLVVTIRVARLTGRRYMGTRQRE